jgi:hypothetical protein
LGDDERGTGYDVLLWIEKQVANNDFQLPEIVAHSANNFGAYKNGGSYSHCSELSSLRLKRGLIRLIAAHILVFF